MTEGTLINLDPDIVGSSASLSASYIDSVLPELMRRYELDLADILAASGVDDRLFGESPDALVSIPDVMRIFAVILRRTADPALGLEIGRCVKARSYHVLGYVVLSSSTLGEAIQRLIRFEKLAGNIGKTELSRQERSVRLIWHCPFQSGLGAFVTEAAITGWVAFAQQLVAAEHYPSQVCFRHAAVADKQRYTGFFRCDVAFEADYDGVEFPADFLDLPITSADPGLGRLMEREALNLLADYDANANLLSAVRHHIYHLLVDGEPSVEQVATRMSMASRTLQSRLRRQGVSYQEVLESLRRDLAEVYIRDKEVSLTAIALLLGFAEQSSFTRAFRRWHGVSPGVFRQRIAQ